jgi:hypothetical protein
VNRVIKSFTLTTAITFAVVNVLIAQNYSLDPGDSILATAQFDDLTVYNILENNISADTLFMSWQKVSADVPAAWEALICDNNNCYSDLKENGTMHPVIPGEYAFLSVHVTPHINSGTAIVRYVVWETNNPSSRDTLTWIISSELTGVGNEIIAENNFLIAGNQLLIQYFETTSSALKIYDMDGRIMAEIIISSPKSAIDISHFPSGVFVVNLKGKNSEITKKIFLQ